jgi:ribosomal protein S20
MCLNGSKIRHRYAVNISISDPDGRRLCEVMMSPEQFASALFGNSHTPCTLSRYWSITDENVLLTERVRQPESIRKRMEKRLKHRLKEQNEALRTIIEEIQAQAESGKPARKTMLKDLATRIDRAVSHSAANAAFTVDQAREEITGIMESAAIQFLGQQSIDAETLWEAAGPALEMSDEPEIKTLPYDKEPEK